MNLILASTSPYRRTLLERLGVPFRCIAPTIDEDALKLEWAEASPRELAERLAMKKALSVAAIEPDAVVIGSDQLVSFQGVILGKPGTQGRAIDQLKAMSGSSHELITAVHVLASGDSYAHLDIAIMRFRQLTHDEIFRYVQSDRPMDCAGSYKLESRGITLFERIESDDHSAIIGLPLLGLTTILRSLGFAIP